MYKKISIVLVCFLLFPALATGQVKVRLFTGQDFKSAVFSVTEGRYELNLFNDTPVSLIKDDLVIISDYNGKLSVKTRNLKGFVCDSLIFSGKTDKDFFSLRINSKLPIRQNYSGDLKCFSDLGTILFINTDDIESYVAGVVKAEGGSGKNIEYFKTQAVITRTYMYKNFEKHIIDRYNLCDNTHCQSFNGLSSDSLIIRAAQETKGLVILGPDSTLIISAFHSNCGGETSPAENVWLSVQTYLQKVQDPYCLASRNAVWQKKISLSNWTVYLKKNGYTGGADDMRSINFSQSVRVKDYRAGSFSIPLRQIREELNLRSTFFSVSVEGDSVLFKGKGYGHGVGLCQEGAMVMASKGFDYKQIISFYYKGVRISDIKYAVEN